MECTHLGKFFGKTEVFRGLHFQYEGALCIGIQGANGSGKSTLLKCLTGLLRPTEGSVTWMKNGNKVAIRSIRYHIGYAAPYIQMYRELSVAENLSFLRQIRPAEPNPTGPRYASASASAWAGAGPDAATFFSSGDITSGSFSLFDDQDTGSPSTGRLPNLLRLTGLSDLAGQEFGTLSSGQQQRVRLAGALVSNPSILVLDEPGTNLDADGLELVSRIVTRHQSGGGMVLLASNREEELRLSDKRIVLSPDRTHHIHA